MHFLDPVAQAIQDKSTHLCVLHIEVIPTARVVFSVQAVVGVIVYSAETQMRPEMVELTGMVEHDVEDHFYPLLMQAADHFLELPDLLASCPGRRQACLGGEIADRHVPQ